MQSRTYTLEDFQSLPVIHFPGMVSDTVLFRLSNRIRPDLAADSALLLVDRHGQLYVALYDLAGASKFMQMLTKRLLLLDIQSEDTP